MVCLELQSVSRWYLTQHNCENIWGSELAKYRIISLMKDVTATHWAAGLTVLWLLVVKNSRFFLPEWAVVNDVEFLRSGGNIIVLTLLVVVIWMPGHSSVSVSPSVLSPHYHQPIPLTHSARSMSFTDKPFTVSWWAWSQCDQTSGPRDKN